MKLVTQSFTVLFVLLLAGCAASTIEDHNDLHTKTIHSHELLPPSHPFSSLNDEPKEWGEHVTGVKTRMHTDELKVALTFDLCGGPFGNQLDEDIVDYLRNEQIPATLFVNERWILDNEAAFLDLANDDLFEIENHGSEHVPLSVTGQEAYGIQGTTHALEVTEEVLSNQRTITERTGSSPSFFRSGTAYYDEVSVEIVQALGLEVVNFDVVGDAGATYSADQVQHAIESVSPGSIVLLHLNQPESDVSEGVKRAIPTLQANGYTFVHLHAFSLE
ncbi:polysaccharide deacetylase family protein [Geomicrobium sp. JCM 19055]|uniref:polysaccharide deacetylase family protein n=1 Tax=Geomicrobium sp. JCM 19055 TaxID=1460649 RepID=UPI0005AA4049|nr:polysaccharide deacetylase family protein [Geomicrobium sp. JCM 19055]